MAGSFYVLSPMLGGRLTAPKSSRRSMSPSQGLSSRKAISKGRLFAPRPPNVTPLMTPDCLSDSPDLDVQATVWPDPKILSRGKATQSPKENFTDLRGMAQHCMPAKIKSALTDINVV